MPGFNTFFDEAKTELYKRFFVTTPHELAEQYNAWAKPSYCDDNHDDAKAAGQSHFFYTSERHKNALHIKKLETRTDVMDDLKALIMKPVLLYYQGGLHSFRFVAKACELLTHLLVGLIDEKHQFDHAKTAAIDLTESAIKMMTFLAAAKLEALVQVVSFVVRLYLTGYDNVKESLEQGVSEAVGIVQENLGDDGKPDSLNVLSRT